MSGYTERASTEIILLLPHDRTKEIIFPLLKLYPQRLIDTPINGALEVSIAKSKMLQKCIRDVRYFIL